VGFSGWSLRAIISLWPSAAIGTLKEQQGMHDLLIALAFVGMVIAPAIVAAKVARGPADDTE